MGTTRRAVLAAGAAAVTATAGCATYGGSQAPPPEAGKLADTRDIPVGGGTVFPKQKVVVTQPEAGVFKAFSAVCTHQGCTVGEVSGGTINCPCHGSKFHVADGTVAHGPAGSPLPVVGVTVTDGSIALS